MRTSESKGHEQRYDSSAVLNLKFLYEFATPHDRNFKFTALVLEFLCRFLCRVSAHDEPNSGSSRVKIVATAMQS